jgi:hypothetical protein
MRFPKIFCFLLNILAVNSDITAFGDCVLHVKRFRDNLLTVDITSLVVVQQSHTNTHPMVSICSTNETRTVKPVGKIREYCSLQIIIGLLPSDFNILYSYMYNNPYTYSSRPHSVYLIILDPLTYSVLIYDDSISLPASILVYKIQTFNAIIDGNAMQSDTSFFYFCLSCNRVMQPAMISKLRFVTEYTYQSEWKEPNLNIQAIIFGSLNRHVTGCEKFIWKKWLATKLERNFWDHCDKPAAFWDLAFRSVHPNVSTTFQTKILFSNPGYSGSFSQKIFYRTSRPRAWEMPVSMFHDFAICGILYCDCLRRSETTSLVTWSVGFSKYDSANIVSLTLLITAFVCIRKCLYSKPGGLMSYIRLFINVLGILLRQGSYKGFLLTAFSL